MKIAAYTNSMDGSGARRAFFEFIKRLSYSNTVHLYHLSGTPVEKFQISDYVDSVHIYKLSQYKTFYLKPYILSLVVDYFFKIKYLYQLKKVSKKMSEDINNRGYDLAYIDVCNFVRVPFQLRYLKIPTVFYHHGPHRDAFEPLKYIYSDFSPEGLSFAKRMYKQLSAVIFRSSSLMVGLVGNRNCRYASLVLTNSHYMQGFLYASCGIIAKLNYLGVDYNYFRPLLNKRKNYVLSVGGLEYAKGFEQIVIALSLIPEMKRPPFTVLTNRKREKDYRQLVKLAEEKKVRLTIVENVFGADLIRYYNEALMVVFVPVMEPFGLVILESLACGTPVIGVREGGVEESIIDGKTGILVDRDGQNLADAIVRLAESEELQNRLSQDGIKYVRENWTWDKAFEQFDARIKKLLQKE